MTRIRISLFACLFLPALVSGCTVITAAVTDDPIRCGGRDDGTVCGNEYDDGVDRICVDEACVVKECGDGFVDTPAGEQCDDANDETGDGCDSACDYSCAADTDCNDGLACNGVESCDLALHTCANPADVVCVPSDSCHSSACDDNMSGACVEALIDGDNDGYASTALGACGTDCNDANAQISPAAQEVCGNATDDDCSAGTPDNTQTYWWADCDGDSYAGLASDSTKMLTCQKPSVSGTGCSPAYHGTADWTSRNPNVGTDTRDCADLESGAHPDPGGTTVPWHTDAIPGMASNYNWNCLNSTEYQYVDEGGACIPSKYNSCGTDYPSPSGWWSDGSKAACGSSEWWEYCGTDISSGGSCSNDVYRAQGCR